MLEHRPPARSRTPNMTRRPAQSSWSNWHPIAGWKPSTGVLAETLDGGQSFRWQSADGVWSGQWLDHLVQIRADGDSLAWRGPAGTVEASVVNHYLGLDTDWAALT